MWWGCEPAVVEGGTRHYEELGESYLNPALLLRLEAIIFGLRSIDGNSLAWGSEIVGATNGRPLSVLHLCDG